MESATLPQGTSSSTVVDKGLKKNAISFVSNIVISVASVAPAYSLAATLGFIAAVGGLGLQSPAVVLIAFIPDGVHRRRLLLHEPGRSGLRHHVRLGDQGDGTVARLAGRLGDRRGGRARDAEPRGRGGQLHLPAVRRHSDDGRGGRGRDRVDHHHDRDLLHRHRAVGSHPAVSAGDGVHDAAGVRGGRADQGLRQPSARTRSPHSSRGSTRSTSRA